MDHSEEQPQADALPEQQQMEQVGTEEEQAAAAALQAAPVDLGQLAALEIPQLVDYSGLSQGQPNLIPMEDAQFTSCRPAITTLIMHIAQHLSNPNGNPQLALTFQPLVNMALNMQLSTSVPDMSAMSAMYNVPSALMAAAAANAGQVQFDPQVLMASATAAAAAAGGTPAGDSAATADGQPAAQQQQKRKGGGRRKAAVAAQVAEDEEEEEEEEEALDDDDDEDWSWRNTKSSRGNSSSRPQRQRKKSRLLQEYLTDDEEALGEPTRGRRAFEY